MEVFKLKGLMHKLGLQRLSRIVPKNFIELSLNSFKEISEKRLKPRNFNHLEFATSDDTGENETPISFMIYANSDLKIVSISPIEEETMIIAIDTSSIEIGQTKNGMICAIRGAIVQKQKGHYHCLRLGPFPFHVTNRNKQELYGLLRRSYYGLSVEAKAPSLEHIQSRIRTILEHWLQMVICRSFRDAIILWDCSLTAGTVDSPINVIENILLKARSNGDIVLAFSKFTRLCVEGERIVDIADGFKPPYILDVDESIPYQEYRHLRFLGRIFVAKLAVGVQSFRLDIDRQITYEKGIEAVQRLIGNDLVLDSYPETLKLAHIYSKFTFSDVVGIQSFIIKNYHLHTVPKFDPRQILFGPFGFVKGDRRLI